MPEKCIQKTKILRAAAALIADHGFHGTSVQMIAEKAGVGVGSLYRYFRDKDELVHAVYEAVREKVESRVQAGFLENQPLRENFRRLAKIFIFHFLEHPADLRFMEQYLASPYRARNTNKTISTEAIYWTLFKSLHEPGKATRVVKDLPMDVLNSLAFGPLVSLLNAHLRGNSDLDEMTIMGTIDISWEAVTGQGVSSCR